jgi:asparagine synthase (glutamine-hydrolysing)
LPSEFDQHRKQGFGIPLASWLQTGSWQNFFREILLRSDNTLFNRKLVSKLLEGQAKGLANGERLFALVMFELWRREYGVSI